MANLTPKVVRTYYQNGELMEEYYTVNGNIEGICNIYYDNGVIYSCSNNINGFKHGEFKSFRISGNIRGSCNYVYDKLNGDGKFYNEGVLWKHVIHDDNSIVKTIFKKLI